MAFNRPTLQTIIGRIETDYTSRLGIKEPARVAFVRAQSRAFAGAVHGLYGFLEFISQQALPDSAVDEYLERWCAIFGLFRVAATAATGSVTITGISGNVIPADTVLQSPAGIQYRTTADATIASGTATVGIQCATAGADGNLPPSSPLSFLSPVAGVNSSATAGVAGVTGGSDDESTDGLRKRLIERIQTPPQGGNVTDYTKWVKEIRADVTRVWVAPLEMGAGTVTVRFVMDNIAGGPLPPSGVVDEVTAYIETKRPVTANVFVVAPTLYPVNMTILLSPGSQAVKDAVTAELKDLFFRDGQPGGTILISRIREAISIAAGETDNTLSTPTANVVADAGSIPVLGTITWS